MDDIVLKLTADEAYTLRMVIDLISGSPHDSRRKHMEEISSQLIAQNVPYANESDYEKNISEYPTANLTFLTTDFTQ